MWKKSGAWFFKSIPYYYSSNNCDSYRHRSPSIVSSVSSTGRKFSSCKESSTNNSMYQEPIQGSSSQVSANFQSSLNRPTIVSNQVSNHGHQEEPSPSNSMVSIDSIGTVNSVATINSMASSNTYSNNNSMSMTGHSMASSSFVPPPLPSPLVTPSSEWNPSCESSDRVLGTVGAVTSPGSSSSHGAPPSPSGFTRNKYNVNSIRILSSRSPIRRKGSSRRSPSSGQSDSGSGVTFQTMSSPDGGHLSESPEAVDAFSSALASNLQSKRFGVHAKTSGNSIINPTN